MNTIPIYVLGIALGFASGILFMLLRSKKPVFLSVLPDPSEIEATPSLEDRPDEFMLTEPSTIEAPTENMTADHWLDEIEYSMAHQLRSKIKVEEGQTDEGPKEPRQSPTFDSTEEVWLTGLKRTHETVSKSSSSSHQTLPIVFDSIEPGNSQ